MKKRTLIIGGVIVLVILLATAAFVGGKLMNGAQIRLGPGGGLTFSGGNHSGPTSFSPKIEPAAGLPQKPADASGIFDHRQDNSIFVGTGKVQVVVQPGPSGSVGSATHNGPTVEVVVTTRTVVYRDTTMDQFNGKAFPNGSPTIQQVLEPGTLDELGSGSLVTAWGKKTGDRIIADVLVYTQPDYTTK